VELAARLDDRRRGAGELRGELEQVLHPLPCLTHEQGDEIAELVVHHLANRLPAAEA
jgi:hypothetical protein